MAVEVEVKNETLIIDISDDKMEAYVIFKAPGKGGAVLTVENIRAELKAEGVVYGLNDNAIDGFAEQHDFGKKYLAAQGKRPGSNQKLNYHFDLSATAPKPKVNDNGSVDFHSLGLIKSCKAGDVLVTTPKAETGMDVFGQTVESEQESSPLDNIGGENTTLSEDGLILTAAVDGRIVSKNKRISISPVFEVAHDVSSATGDVVFSGEVIVNGSVRSGYRLVGTKGVLVKGEVEAANIESDGDVVLEGGARGAGTGHIKAGGSVTARFLENCTVDAGEDIAADSVLHCQVNCGKQLRLTGNRGVLVGGKAVVRDKVTAHTIGSAMSTPTEISVGHDPNAVTKYEQLNAEYNATKKQYDEADKAVSTLGAKGALDERKKTLLVKLLTTKIQLRNKLNETHEKIEEIIPVMKGRNGSIAVTGKIFFGVKVTIGDAIMYVKDDLSKCVLRNREGKVEICP
jgi:uncharacterized protein (DUF342 family)